MSIAAAKKCKNFFNHADVTTKHRTHAGETHDGDARA